MQELQDEAIIQLILQGDTKAYVVLVERYQHFVFTLVKKITDSQEDAEEIAQDAFVKAYQSLHTYDGRSKFSTWLYTIARNTALSHYRKQRLPVNQAADVNMQEQPDHMPEKALEQKSNKTAINKAISLLNTDDQTMLSLFYIQEQTIEEIATILNITTGNVKVKLYRARKRLKEILDSNYKNEFAEYRTSKDIDC